MTGTAREIALADLAENGPSTSHEIAKRTGLRPLQVSNTLTWARGEGQVNDGTTMYEWPGTESGCAHRPDGPVTWSMGEAPVVKGRCPVQHPEDYEVAVRGTEKGVMVRHNHVTRDIKAPGICPACDAHRTFADQINAETAEVSETEFVVGVD